MRTPCDDVGRAMVKTAPTLGPVFWVSFLLLLWAARLVQGGDWKPLIEGCYVPSRGAIQATIAPPLPGAHGYYVGAERWDDDSIYFDLSKLVTQSDTKFVYEITDIPSERTEYIILVRPRDIDGVFLTSYFSSSSFFSVPSPTCSFNHSSATKMTSSPSLTSSSTSTSSSSLLSSSPTSTTRTGRHSVVPSHVIIIGTRATQSVGSSTATDPNDHGFHMEKWVIVTLAVIIGLLFVFIGVMVYVGRECRARRNQRLSFCSRTSQEGTTTETLPHAALEMAATLPLQLRPPHHYHHHSPQQQCKQHEGQLQVQQQYEQHEGQLQCNQGISHLLPEAEQDSTFLELLT